MAVLNVELIYQKQVMFDIENILVNKRNDTNRIIQIDMGIANKTISTTFLNIIIRTNHGQTYIVMQYGGLWRSVMCVTTSCSNGSFASPTHRTNQSLNKGLRDVFPLVYKCVTQLLWCFWWNLTVANTSTEFVPYMFNQ